MDKDLKVEELIELSFEVESLIAKRTGKYGNRTRNLPPEMNAQRVVDSDIIRSKQSEICNKRKALLISKEELQTLIRDVKRTASGSYSLHILLSLILTLISFFPEGAVALLQVGRNTDNEQQ
jgi:hypothetical protein